MLLELVAAHSEELCAVIKCCIFDTSRGETTTNTTTFIKHGYVMTMRGALACCHETGKTGAYNNDAHGHTATAAACPNGT